MPYPDEDNIMEGYNRLIYDELNYDKEELRVEHENLYRSLTSEQKSIYETVMEAVEQDTGGMFFIYGYGGTGKTYLYKTMSVALRSQGGIVLNVASSGIAALLLEGGRTAHSRFAIPINVMEDSHCHIAADGDLAELLIKAKLIIWDEAPMMNRYRFEAFDRSLRDICMSHSSVPSKQVFGGKVVVYGGDFRQILPVVPGCSRQDVVHASLNASYLWEHCKVMKLTVNLRLESGSSISEKKEIKEFADWILDIGNGNIGGRNDGESIVEFPDDMLIPKTDNHVDAVIQETYPQLVRNLWNHVYLKERAILAPTHELVDVINERMLDFFPDRALTYESSDSVALCDDEECNYNLDVYTTEVLNNIKMSGVPNHMLTLKVGAHIMCMRNIDQKAGLCNGTRLQVSRLGHNIIEGKIISGGNVGTVCAIPRMIVSPSDKKNAFQIE